jgi:hypothetical protein
MKLSKRASEGDVIYTNCKDIQMCYHLGIVYDDGKNKYVYHNAPSNLNKYGGTVICEKIEDFLRERDVLKVIKTDAKNEDIVISTRNNKYEVWDTLFFNCEDYVVEIVEGKRKSDLRDAWKIAILSFIFIAIY